MADKDGEQLKEQIKFEVEWLKLTAIAVLAVGGGSFGLLLGEITSLRLVLAVGGLLATLGLMGDLLRQRGHIQALIEQVKEER
jgi:hypothetical protein